MMQSQTLLEVFLVCIVVPTLSSAYPMTNAYPVYGTKRYNRPGSSSTVRSSSLGPMSSWRQPPSAVRYFPDQAYAEPQQDEVAGFYYYPDNRRRRYQQQYLYYPARYSVNDPVEDLEDTMRREEEGWYDDSTDDANVMRAFAPAEYYPGYYTKYNTRPRQHAYYPEDYYDNPFDMYRYQQYQSPKMYGDESHEEDFKESNKMPSRHFEKSPYDYLDGEEDDDAWINWGSKRAASSNTKANAKVATAVTTNSPNFAGQKEIVQPRPAVQPFRLPELLDDENNSLHEKRAAPGVYNTIRKLIAMEKDLEGQGAKKAPMKKRFVASGEDFVQELNSLKKRRA